MYLWRCDATANWLARHETELNAIAGISMAVIERPGRARRLVEATCQRRGQAEELTHRFGGVYEKLPRNWEKTYLQKQAHPPLRIGRRLVIVAEPGGAPNELAQLLIPAAGAFGTGEHPTTAMSLRMLEESSRRLSPGWSALDLGTGTGILALAARRFGARRVLALDLDARALAHARANAQANGIARVQFVRADVTKWSPPAEARFDLLSANLFSELLVAAAPMMRRALRPGGTLIASGILQRQTAEVAKALRRAGFSVETMRRRGKWVALRCR